MISMKMKHKLQTAVQVHAQIQFYDANMRQFRFRQNKPALSHPYETISLLRPDPFIR